jgi:branched-chain amino acid transport system permease protein
MSARRIRLIEIAIILALAAAPLYLGSFRITLLNYVGVYGLAALGLVLLTGIGGMVSMGQAAFVGLAAYATAWATALQGYSPWIGLGLALIVTGVAAAAIGIITLRLGGHFLALSTVAWGLSIYFLLGNVEGLGRFNGISGVPPVSIGSLSLTSSASMFYVIWGVVIAALFLARNVLNSREGRAMRVLRGGNTLVESLGISSFRAKLITFVMSALLAALSGWLYAHLSRFVSPSPFDVNIGIDYLMMAMVGGASELIGGVVGSGIVTFLKNGIQDYLPIIAKGAAGQLEIVVFSLIFIVFLQHARSGVVPFIAGWLPKGKEASPTQAEPLTRRPKPSPRTPLLRVEGVYRRFGGLVAVDNVSFELAAGEILGLIGPNGAGKSTMFNLLTGALHLNGGRIYFQEREISGLAPRHIARAGVARTFQHVKIRPRMTLLDNVLLGTYARTKAGFLAGALRLDRAEEARARYEALTILKRVGLGDRPFELAGNLPLGNQRLLEVARALAADPILLMLDEPAAGLRKQEKRALADLLRSLRTEQMTILLVEHDMDFVMGLVDRIVVMNFGSKLCEGTPGEIRRDPSVQDAYLGGAA